MRYEKREWIHPNDPHATGRPELGVVHRNQLIVDETYWAEVRAGLSTRGVELDDESVHIAYGLVRIVLPEQYESAAAQQELMNELQADLGDEPALGFNHLVAHSVMAFDDDDAKSTPKVLPFLAKPAEPAPRGTGLPAAPRRTGDATPGGWVRVGVVDSACTRHDYLTGACLYEPTELADLLTDGAAGEVTGHATFIAGLIKHVAPGASVQVETVISPAGLGDLVAVHDAVCRLIEDGVHVINLSLGCVTADNQLPFALDHALGWAQRQHREPPIFVASAGNAGDTQKFWPAADPRVWAVAGGSRADGGWELASYSGRGDWVDLAAPSDDLLGPRPRLEVGLAADWSAYAYWSGTSFATAVISGLLARRVAQSGTTAGLVPGPSAPSLSDHPIDIKDGNRLIPMYGLDAVILRE